MDNFESSAALRTIEKDILDDIRDMEATRQRLLPETPGTEGAGFESFLQPGAGSGPSHALGARRGATMPAAGREKPVNFEAIVLSIARPSLLVRDGTYVEPQSESKKVLEIIR